MAQDQADYILELMGKVVERMRREAREKDWYALENDIALIVRDTNALTRIIATRRENRA
jgi:hypothetical protein